MEHSIYLRGIKSALRARGETYGDLAVHLRMTVSGVKKMLNAKDISFRRILQICDALEVLPGQLFSLAEKSSIPVVRFTATQEDALLKDRKLLSLYWRFAIENKRLDEISELDGLAPSEVTRSLQKLVTLDLISQRKGKFLAKNRGKFRWPDDSKLARLLNKEWSQLALPRALSGASKGDSLHRLVALRLSEASREDFERKLRQVLEEAIQISEREELTMSQNTLRDFMALVCLAKGGVFERL